jgi:uncharacterized protein (DUF433 family)
MATVPVMAEHIEVTPGVCGGKPRIAGRRIKVAHIALWHEPMGMTPERILAEYPGLSLADIHAALAYYRDHRAEIDEDLRAEEAFARDLADRQPSLIEELAARSHAQDPALPPG